MSMIRPALILLSLAFITAATVPAPKGFRVIESNDRSITVEFTPQYDSVRFIRSGDTRFSLLTFAGSASDGSMHGVPDMKYIAIPLALPGRDGATAEIMRADYQTIAGFNQAPVPAWSASGAGYTPEYARITGFYPANTASVVNVSEMHGGIVGYLKIYPLQFDPASKTLKKCTRMMVRVTYGARERVDAHAAGRSALSRTAVVHSVRSEGRWFKLEVVQDGMVRIDAAYLKAQGIDPSSLSSIRDIRIYGGNGHPMNPDLRTTVTTDPPQCAVLYGDHNANGKFDGDDDVLFYAQGAAGWTYKPDNGEFSHWINPYSSSNYYLMQIASGGTVKEMRPLQSPSSAATIVTTSVGTVFVDDDKINFNQSGLIWVGSTMNGHGTTSVLMNKLTGYIGGTPVTYRYELFAVADAVSTFAIEESDTLIATAEFERMSGADQVDPEKDFAFKKSDAVSVVPRLTNDRSTVKFTYTCAGDAKGYINWLEIIYRRRLTASDNELVFTSPDIGGTVEYDSVAGFTTNAVMGFDVTDINNVKIIDLQLQQQMGTFRFRDELVRGAVKKYWIGALTASRLPKSIVRLPASDLHGTAPGTRFVIITHRDFVTEAARLKAYKERLHPDADSIAFTTMVVECDSIYNEFGAGMLDPTAIRNFLSVAQPDYVLFFGDASFNYRGLAGIEKGWVPTWESEESNNKISSYCSDDYYAYTDSSHPGEYRLGMGRLPVRSIDEARRAVDRIIRYESDAARGEWTNTITIVGDDEWVGPDKSPEPEHTNNAENLAVYSTPPAFDIRKIYIADYPTEISPQGRRKPGARQAIIDQVNRGTLLLNFTGHGNPQVWAHESILSLEDAKSVFSNRDRLTFVVAATCDWGKFDMTEYQSSAEEILKNENGGAIGVVSATRGVYSGDNLALNQCFYEMALPRELLAPIPRVGDAFRNVKNSPRSGGDVNKAKYQLLCDPTLRLAIPRGSMTIDTINDRPVNDAAPDTIGALEKVSIKASVRNRDMAVDRSFNGSACITVYDADTRKLLPNITEPVVMPGSILYHGECSVTNGILQSAFIVPKDIAYDNRNGKISVYFSSSSADGRGYTTGFVVAGTSGSLTADTQGPSISLYFDTPSFRPGDVVGEEPTLIVALSDSSGINSAGTGIGHRIEAWIDGSPKSLDLTPYYKSKRDSYQDGMVEYVLPKMEEGMHDIVVKAWDVYNNASTAEASFTVAGSGGLSILNLYNFPNPADRQTTFTFQHNQLTPVDVQIRIYSVAGRLIARIDRFAVSDRFVQIPWDCRDNDGDVLGNGVYFYKITAKTVDGMYSSEALGRLAVMK